MRLFLPFVFLYSTVFSVSVRANDQKPLDSRIDAVTVFLNAAQVERVATVTLTAGTNELLLKDLSSKINENSIQVSGLRDASILALNYNIDYLEKKTLSTRSLQLQSQLAQLKLSENRNQNQLLGLTKEQEVLEKNQRVNSNETSLELAKLQEIASYHRQRINKILDEKYEIQLRLEVLKEEIANISKEFRKIEGDIKQLRGAITLKLDTPQPVKLSLRIRYTIRNVGWYPMYDIKAKNSSQPLAINYKANVYQQTGTDWNDVRITLSTGDPSTNNSKPELNPKYLNFVQPQLQPYYSKKINSSALEERIIAEKEMNLKDNEALSAANEDQIPEPYNETVYKKLEGLTSTQFEIAKRYTIASNAEITIIDIDRFSMPAAYNHYAAPVLSEKVYLTALIGNWEQYNLLEGEANIYFEGSYAGKTKINPQATTDSLTISLGVDPGISIKRRQLDNLKSKSFIGTTQIIDRSYEINVKNNKADAIQLILEDRIPVSQNKELKIEDYKIGNAKFNTQKGILRWEFQLGAKATEKKQFSYRIKYPKGQQINL